GLWHGATWMFVIWGLLHGLGLASVRAIAGLRKRFRLARRNTGWSRALSIFITFHFVCLAWVFFRAESVDRATAMFRQLCDLSMDTANLALPVVFVITLSFIAHWTPDRIWEQMRDGFARLPAPVQACMLFVLAIGLYRVASSDVVPFIYSRF